MSNPSDRPSIHPLSIVGALILALVILAAAYLFLRFGGSPAGTSSQTAAPVTIIPAPTLTPVIIQPTAAPTPTATETPLLVPGVFGIGAYVKVTNTGGAGLRMRESPTTLGLTQFVAMDDELFHVLDGPVDMDGYRWWKLAANYDQTRVGWASEAYLSVVVMDTPAP